MKRSLFSFFSVSHRVAFASALVTALMSVSPSANAWCYYGVGDTCGDGGTGGGTADPLPILDRNPLNRLQPFRSFSGKNYHVAVTGGDIVADTNGDQQANRIDVPSSVVLDIPQGAQIEAAFLYYMGSIFYKGNDAVDDTDDTRSGAELGLDSDDDAAKNEVDVTINGETFDALTPANVGGESAAMISWWKLFPSAGTLQDSKVGFYSNRLDIKSMLGNSTGLVTVSIDRLQRADFAGNQYLSDYMWTAPPQGNNGNGERANDCLANASFSVVVVYSLPTGPKKTIELLDGVSWVWNNDFATNSMKTYDPIQYPLAVDLDVTHAAVSNQSALNVYVTALDGDKYGHSGVTQCGSYSFPHKTGADYTWVGSGGGATKLYKNIYEGDGAPADGQTFANYGNVSSVAKGINFNVTKIAVEGVSDGATITKLHFEGDAEVSTDIEQEAFLLATVIVEGVLSESDPAPVPDPTNSAPVISLIGEGSVELTTGDTFVDLGATATDAEDGDLTASISTQCNVNTEVAGFYSCTYSVSDSAGAQASITRTIEVVAGSAPVVCKAYSGTLSSHETAGRAYTKTTNYWTTTYYAKGSNQKLTGSWWSSVTLHNFNGESVYYSGGCP